MPTINAYLVDVEQRTIRPVTLDQANSLAEIRRHIGCGLIDMVRIDGEHSVVVDDNGLADELTCYTDLKDYLGPLAGNLLIVGHDDAGEAVSPRRPIEDFAAMLTIRYPVLLPSFEVFNGLSLFGSHVVGFIVTLKGVAPTVLPGGPAH